MSGTGVRHEATPETFWQFFTPPGVAQMSTDRILNPSCGDGQFLALHRKSVSIEVGSENAATARQPAPIALVHSGEFFTWALKTAGRIEV